MQNPTPDDGVAEFSFYNDDLLPFGMNIDPNHTPDPTPNDHLTLTVPSPTVP